MSVTYLYLNLQVANIRIKSSLIQLVLQIFISFRLNTYISTLVSLHNTLYAGIGLYINLEKRTE